jgi:phosphate transport system permease protein
LRNGVDSPAYAEAKRRADQTLGELQARYDQIAARVATLRKADEADTITLADVSQQEKSQRLSAIVRIFPANDLNVVQKLGVYLSRWWEYVSDEPREANTEGGVLPAIFGTLAMTILLSLIVTPFGVITALYLREYARQGPLVSIVRISVNNLAGVPSIVYGVFGLGFFAYILGGSIDQAFFPERLPNPTFGTGGLLWASLTLALMTVPVVIVATEEALSAVPRSMREGSLACGASKWQTIRMIVLPRAMPGIMTGLILAMARGAGEVAPLMLVGVVKLAPELPVDGVFPFVHLERSFMHLGFHIFDVGFQSRNSEAGKPMVFVTTLLLVALIAAMNATAIVIRTRLKRRFAGSQF